MKNSYILRLSRGRVLLTPQIMDQLALVRDSRLYGVAAPDDDNESRVFILSNIPVRYWQSSYRLQVYTASRPGSLSKVAAALSKSGINILAAWTAATTSAGEGCLTATMHFRGNEVPDEGQIKKITDDLKRELISAKALSVSRLFQDPDPLSLIRITKLQVLAKLGSLYGGQYEFQIGLSDSTLDLGAATLADGSLFSLDYSSGYKDPAWEQVIVTPDTEEGHFRLAVLPTWRYRQLSIDVNIESKEGQFSGYYDRAISVLAGTHLNIISSKNILMSKLVEESGEEAERARFSFLVDFEHSKLPSAKLKGHLEKMLKKKLEEGGGKITFSNWKSEELWELQTPVFVATNAKPSMSKKWKNIAISVIRKLKERGLRPVNVEISVDPSLTSEIEALIRCCPLMVSLFLPEEGLRMERKTQEGKGIGAREKTNDCYAPSDFTMYEEAFARSLRRPILRLRHKAVFRPRYLGNPIEYEFDEGNLSGVIKFFEAALDQKLKTDAYRKACEKSQKYQENDSLGLKHFFRDTERWLLGYGR